MKWLRGIAARWYVENISGQVAEWLKAHAWKVCIRETVSRVRIPPCPPFLFPRDEAQPRPLEKNNNRGFEMRTGSTTRPTGREETKRSVVNLIPSAMTLTADGFYLRLCAQPPTKTKLFDEGGDKNVGV